MSLLIPIQDDTVETFVNRFAALLSVDVTREMEVKVALFAADIQSGQGTIVFVEVISDVLDAAR